MEVSANYLGGTKFEAGARGHRVICDLPRENGGTDEGLMPPELLLASLATCAAYYAAEFLKGRELSTDGLKVNVTAEKLLHPARLASFAIDVTAPGANERSREGLLRAVKACLIHNTLTGSPEIGITLHTADLAHV